MKKFVTPKKQPKACWTRVKSPSFKRQAQQLRPELSAAGGIKSRSGSEAVRMAVYNAIVPLFLAAHPMCDGCSEGCKLRASQIHHRRGRSGLLLLDVRYWSGVCGPCHYWIGNNMEQARTLGLLAAPGDWNKQDEI